MNIQDVFAAMPQGERGDWYDIAVEAQMGNARAKALIAGTFGPQKLLGLTEIARFAYEAMSPAQKHAADDKNTLQLKIAAAPVLSDAQVAHLVDVALPKLTYYRKLRGLTQQELSARSGVNKMTISKLERGVAKMENITLANATALAKALDIRVEDLWP